MMKSSYAGYINLTVHDPDKNPFLVNHRKTAHVPDDHVVMVSFPKFVIFKQFCPARTFEVSGQGQDTLWRECDANFTDTYIFEERYITLHWRNVSQECGLGPCVQVFHDWQNKKPLCISSGCIQMLFSFHHKTRVPQRLSSGLYNCSVDDYWRFQQHLDCNMKVECEDGRDETGHCPFSSPACQGWVASRGKCYMHFSASSIDKFETSERITLERIGKGPEEDTVNNFAQSYRSIVQFCGSVNASIGTPRNSHDVNTVFEPFFESAAIEVKEVAVGLFYGGKSVPNMYRRSMFTYDRTVIHHTLSVSNRFFGGSNDYDGERLCFTCDQEVLYQSCRMYNYVPELDALCEITVQKRGQHESRPIRLPQASMGLGTKNVSLLRCPGSGQWVHFFLACDPHKACGPYICTMPNSMLDRVNKLYTKEEFVTPAPVFTCGDDLTTLSYTLVCDFRQHCQDGNDETFCQHPPCAAFACSNGQCVSYSKRCDLVSDCLDDSDELLCAGYTLVRLNMSYTYSPVHINFDGKNSFIIERMNPSATCPETHYRCPGEYNDCLPVYTLCNGWYDCMDHEDEDGCQDMTCPGFYRCFNSSVCVHSDSMCDGWPHCPEGDDEWLCDMTCPKQCLCQGHAFLCPQPFSAHLFPQLRYLDGRGSGMTPSDLTSNHYIVHLSLSRCALSLLPSMAMKNLQFLDLSENSLVNIDMNVFIDLVNIRELLLGMNPIHRISNSMSTKQLNTIRTVDLSQTKLTNFNSKVLSSMFNVRSLNLSFSAIHTVHPNGFRYTLKLSRLYLAGNPINTFPADMFKPLRNLDVITAHTYKLCCRRILPEHFELIDCDAPRDEISSCEDLLQSGTYRAFLWMIGFLSLLGNMVCIVMRLCVQRKVPTSGFQVFVTHLSMADLLMGVYIAIIGVADSLFRTNYLFYEQIWTTSVACKVAGFLSLLSCEVSALIIWLITLDRFIVLHFPFSSVRFQRTSAAVACLLTWLVGLLLAVVPLLPVTSHWEFFSQTGICIPLPVTRQDFKGKAFSVTVFIIFNFVLFLLVATGQAFIYWSVQKNALKTDSTKASRDLTIARRLISVAVTNFLCWFPIGLCGLLALGDTPIPGEINVALAIFVLPLNSALNPFIYTFNMLMEKRRKSTENMLLNWLKSQADLN